jgi:hypothetical protein
MKAHTFCRSLLLSFCLFVVVTPFCLIAQTVVDIRGERFFINDEPRYKGRTWNGSPIAGLLFNARMVQGVFDDANPETRTIWQYPDTHVWDPERNTKEFVEAMDDWRTLGMVVILGLFYFGQDQFLADETAV